MYKLEQTPEIFKINFFRIFKNHILLFTVNRYIVFSLQVITGFFIAKALDPYLFGIWGFLLLIMMYLSFTSFGLQYALTLKLSTELDTDYEEREKTIAVTLTLTYLIAGLLTLSGLGIQLFDVPLFQKYLFNKYVVYIGAIAGINHCLEVFKNIYRIYNRLVKIAASELIRVVLIFLVVLTFKGENLISAMLGVIILSGIINIAIFLIRAPFRITYLFLAFFTNHQ